MNSVTATRLTQELNQLESSPIPCIESAKVGEKIESPRPRRVVSRGYPVLSHLLRERIPNPSLKPGS